MVYRSAFIYTLLCCWQARAQTGVILSDARVAPDAQKFALSATINGAFGVYEQPLAADSPAQKISPEAPAFHCFAPAYSPDGNYLLYLKSPLSKTKKVNYTDVILYNRQTRSSTQLTTGQQNIQQALFSPDGTRIVYTAAGFFGSYSPAGPKMAHELDVYSMALDGSSRRQHSAIKAYSLGTIAFLQAPDTYLLNISDIRHNLSGTYVFSLSDSTNFRLVKDSVAAAHQRDYIPNLTVSAQRSLVYSISDDLFVKNMRTGHSSLAHTGQPHSNPHPMSFVGNQNIVMFSERQTSTSASGWGAFSIKLLNLDDLKITPVTIRLEQ